MARTKNLILRRLRGRFMSATKRLTLLEDVNGERKFWMRAEEFKHLRRGYTRAIEELDIFDHELAKPKPKCKRR